jgi:hypothetical protein
LRYWRMDIRIVEGEVLYAMHHDRNVGRDGMLLPVVVAVSSTCIASLSDVRLR